MASQDSNSPTFELREAPGMGLGMFALADIPKGSLILREKPLCVVPSESDAKLEDFLPTEPEIREKIFSLKISGPISPDADEKTKFDRICHANGLGNALFEISCRINHSCDPNSFWYWNESVGEVFIMATKDIPAGSQIFISYVFQYKSQKGERRDILKKSFHFQCECSLCMTTVNPKRKNHPNKVRRRYKELCEERSKNIGLLAIVNSDRMEQLTQKSIIIINVFFDGAPVQLFEAYFDMYLICRNRKDWTGALEWIIKCMDIAIFAQTNQGPLVKQALEHYVVLTDSGKVNVSASEKKTFLKRYKGGNYEKSELGNPFAGTDMSEMMMAMMSRMFSG
eukprot:198606_1